MTDRIKHSHGNDFGHDGISGLVNRDRGIRAREVSQPTESDFAQASLELPDLLARVTGKPAGNSRKKSTGFPRTW